MYADGGPVGFGIEANADLLARMANLATFAGSADILALESVASYGMAVGAEVFETCVWSGRFLQRWEDARGPSAEVRPSQRIYRREVKLHLCGSSRAKDPNVRQALIDRYGPGKDVAIGRKATPGPLYGVTSHVWSALAVAVTADETDCGAREAA